MVPRAATLFMDGGVVSTVYQQVVGMSMYTVQGVAYSN